MDDKQSSADHFSSKLKQYENGKSKDRCKVDCGNSNKNKDLGNFSSMHHEATTGFDGSDLLVAEGIAAQQKRSALSSKAKPPKHHEEPPGSCLIPRERIKALEDELKVRDSIISVILKEIGEGETSVDASVGPINSSLQMMDDQQFPSVYSPKLQNVIQLLRRNGWDSINFNQFQGQSNIPDLNQLKFSEMESLLKEKEHTIRELNLELAKRADTIAKLKEDYKKQHSKSCVEIKNLNSKIEKLSNELRKKDVELHETREALTATRSKMEENFRRQFTGISDFLKDQRGNGESSLKLWLDDTIMKYVDSHENEVACYKKQIETLQNYMKEYELSDHEHELELMASRKAHEAHASGYKEHVDSLLNEIDSIKKDHLEQIEKLQNEIERHVEEEETLKKQHSDDNRKHHENVSEFLKTYDDLEKTYFKCKAELDKRNDAIKVINEELAKKNAEVELHLNEIHKYKSIVESFKRETQNSSQYFENDRKQLETKYKAEIDSLHEKADLHKREADHLRSDVNNLLEIAKCPMEELKDIIRDHQFCEHYIREINGKSKSSEMEMEKIKQELIQSKKCHEDDVATYKNQILNLKEELGSMASFEERLFMELSNHIRLRDDFRSLFKPIEMEAIRLDNKSCDFSNFKFSSSGDQNFNVLSDHCSESAESDDASSVSKRKCNIGVQPHSSSNVEKNLLRQALVSELHKEMECRKLELYEKNKQIECFTKANNDLNEHCKSLEAKYEELKDFTEEKIEEIEGLNNSNKELSYRIEQLESENVHLKSKMEAVSDELSNRKAELDNITDLFDFNSDDSGKRTHSFQMKRLFRNVPSSTPNVVAATALAKFDKSKSNSHSKAIDMIVEQISHFQDLEEENEKLKRNVEKMTCDMKEDDYLTQVLKNELLSFQEKTQNLEKRLNLLECEKKNLFKFEKMVEHLSAKNKQLQETQDALQNRIAQLEEENSVLERKCNELKIKFTLDSAHDDDTGCEILENLILDFSKKAEEALSLKEELSVKQESINKLENELDGFRESKINMQMNIDILMSDLLESEEKLTLLKQNRMDIGVEKRMLEQKLVSLQVKYDQLVNESQRQAEMSLEYNSVSNQSSTELSCKKQLLQTRSLCSGDWYDNGNVEFALSSLISLEQEKEFLKQKMRMFEQFLHKFLDSGCDRNELENMKSNLRDMYEQLEVNFSNFSLKSNSLKESNFDQLITKFEILEKQYKDTCTVLNSEKEELQKHVNNLQNELEKMQEEMTLFKMNSEKELFDKDLKIRQTQLGLKALQMDNFAASYGLACKSDSKIDISKQYQKEMEKIHELALSKLKTVYLNQIEENNEKAEQREKDIAEKYQKQIEALQQDLKEKTLHHHEMKTKYLESILNSPANNDLKTLAEMKTEHNSHIEEIKTLLKEECEREKAVLKCNIEAQLKEEYKTKVKNLEKEYKNNLNTLQWIIGCEESGHNVESRSVVLFNRLLRLVNWEYKKQLENLSEAWNSKYSEYISNVNKKLSEVDIVAPKYTADSDEIDLDVTGKNDLEKALSLKEKLIKSCEEFYTFLLEFHKSSLENVMTNLKDAHNEVTSRVDEMRLELEKGCLIASLNNKIDDLEKENEELKCQLKSAIGLLSNDHGTESVNVTNLLKDSSIVGDYMDHTSLIDVEAKVEERLKKQYEEQFVKQRKYFENLVAELGKNYSDGIMIQHSCRLSGCSTNSGSDSNYDLNNVGTNSLTSEDKGFKTDANNSLKIMKQDEKNQLKRHRDDTLASNQTDFPSSHKDNTRNNTNYEDQIATKKQCSESIQFSNSSSKLLQSGDEYLELAPEETVQDVIEEFGSTWKEPDCNLIEPGTDKNDSTQFGFESKLFHLQNEKRELERVIETLSKQNNVNEDRISALEGEINEYRFVTSNSFCGNCRKGKSTENKPSRVNNYSSSSSQYIEQLLRTEPKIHEKYEYLLKSLQQRVDLLAENLSLEAVVKNIVDNVKTSYESDIEVMQFQYDRRAAMENSKSEELIRKFDQCLAKINSQHFFEKEELVKKMNSIVQDYEDKLRENNEHLVRLIDSQKNLEAKHDEEMKFTKLEFENYLVEILSDCISKFALQSSVMDIEGSREEYESELKQRTDDIAKVIQSEYENRLEEERRIMLKEFCELQRNPQVHSINNDVVTADIQEIEKKISEKYEQKLLTLASKHEAELSNLKTHYELRLQQLVEKYESDRAEFMSNGSNCEMSDNVTVATLIKERDDMHKVVLNLRTAVSEIGKYLLNCEDELNKTLIQSMISNFTDGDVVAADHDNSLDCDSSLAGDKSKHVHFAPDVSTIVEGDFLLDCIDKRHDISIEIRNELEACMKRLKSEAAAVLQLTAAAKPPSAATETTPLRSVESRRLASVTRQLVDKNKQIKELEAQLKLAHQTIAKYEQDLAEIRADLEVEKAQREKDKANSSLESVYADKDLAEQAGIDSHFQNLSQLQEKARTMVNESSECVLPQHTMAIVEEMCHHVDHILEEARKEKEDLQSQIDSADKQLRNTRKFLDDQANERELERDEFTRAITKLKQQLQDKERDWMSKERFASEVEALEQKVQETTNLLKETEEKKDAIDRELKEADQKVLVLKEVIRDLECQDRTKTQRQMTLEQRLDELERELESQKIDQNAMVLELEAMQNGSPRDINLKQLEEHFKKQFNPNVVEQMKSQLREMARSIQRQTKYMEGLNVHVSSASLSSPSEDISIREQLDLFKCQTPEGCRSPLLSLPTDEISLLQDQLTRHTKIEEIAMKRIRDQEMQLNSLQSRYEDVLAEKEVLQVKCDKQLSTIASTKTTLDEVRRRAEWQQNKCDAINLDKIAVLEKEVHTLQNSIRSKEREVATHQQQISNLQRIVADKEVELCNYVDSQNNQVEFLQQKLKVMEIEKEKMIVMLNKMREGHNISLPALMEELLAEKNADIDYLEQMVKELRDGHVNTSFVESQNSSKKSSNSNSKGYRVSFADDVEVSHMNDGERTRDANFSNVMHDFSPHFSSSVKTLEKSEQRMITPLLHPIAEDDSRGGGDCTPSWQRMSPPRNDINQQEEMKIRMDELEKELIWKTELIDSYEKRLQEIPQLEGELKRARDDLASTISEISEDKKYYQERLELMTTLQKQLNERDSEVQDLKDVIAEREENLVRVMSDVKSLQLILEKSQKKIEDAKKAAVSDDTKRLSEEVERLKDENIHHVQEILVLKKELNKIPLAEINLLKENLNDEQKASEKLRSEVSSLLNEKEAVIAELEASKQRYQSLKKELENASSKLLMTEKEIDKLHNDLESSTELNDVLKNKLYEANHEINLISRKMSSEMSNRIQKESNDLLQMKDELERLRSINRSLESDCESLKKELNNMIGEANAMARISENNSKAKELEVEVDKLRDEREMLLQSICTMKEKFDTEKSRCETIISAAEAYKNSETLAQEKVLKEKELRISAEKKSQFLKREYEKLKRAKKELEKKNTVLKDELDKEKKHTMELENSPMRGRKTLADLQVTPVDAIEIVPFENKITGSIDDLTDQLQNELDMSARLDDTLLSTLDMQANSPQPVLPSQSLVAVLHRVIKHGFKNLTREEMDHLYEELTLHTHRPPRIADLMERINKLQNELRKQLKNVDNLHEEVDVERSSLSKEKERVVHLETEIDRLQKIISYQEERLASLSSIVEQNRTQMSDLKLSLLKEKGNFKKLHVLFEGERDKIKQIQKEDTELIEDLRICLEKEKDSKVRLQLCLEQERERLQTLEAQLNAAQAAEQIVPRPPNQSDHLNKCLDEWRGKLTEIGVELEREKRHVDSLSAALSKEKEENDHLRTELYKKSSECIDLQAEVEQLKCEIGKERSSNREINEKLKTIQEAEMRRQRNRAAAEEKHKRALERAKIQKRDLEAEVARLKTQLVTIKGEEALPSWSDDVESEPLLNQIKDVNLELEKLGREKKQLTSTVKALLEENEHLELLISQSTGKQFPESELSYFISLYIRSKGHRKALVWQKRYLMLSLQGYQDEGQRLAMKISSSLCVNRSWIPQVSVASRPSFKHAALVIIAITRMKKIMNCRKVILGIHYKTQSPMKEHLIRRKLKLSSPTNDKILSVHSPIREIDFLTSPQRNLDGKSEGLLKPTRLADYLETFNKLQARLSQALSPPDNISLGLESKILSKVSN